MDGEPYSSQKVNDFVTVFTSVIPRLGNVSGVTAEDAHNQMWYNKLKNQKGLYSCYDSTLNRCFYLAVILQKTLKIYNQSITILILPQKLFYATKVHSGSIGLTVRSTIAL